MLAVTVNVLDPAVAGVPERTPAGVRVRPSGRVPEDTVNVGAGIPDAVNVYEYAAPMVAVAGGVLAANTGATGAGSTITVKAPVVAFGATPLLAVTVKVEVPVVVGVPERTPAVLRVSPGGRVPEDTVNVGAGTPAAVNVYEYAAPTVPVAGGVLAVNTGAAGVWITDTVLLPKFAT